MSVNSDNARDVSDSESEDWCMITYGRSQDEDISLTPEEINLRCIKGSAPQREEECAEGKESQNENMTAEHNLNKNDNEDFQELSQDIRHFCFIHDYDESRDITNFNEKITAVINASTPKANSDFDTMIANDTTSKGKETHHIPLQLPINGNIDDNVIYDSEGSKFISNSDILKTAPQTNDDPLLPQNLYGPTVSNIEPIDGESNNTITNDSQAGVDKNNEFARISELLHDFPKESAFSGCRSTVIDFDKGEISYIPVLESPILSPTLNDISLHPVLYNVASLDEDHQNISKATLKTTPSYPTYLDLSMLIESEFETKVALPECKRFLSASSEFSNIQRNEIIASENPKLACNQSNLTFTSTPLSSDITETLFHTENGLDTVVNDCRSATITNENFNSGCYITSATYLNEMIPQDSTLVSSGAEIPMLNSGTTVDSAFSSLSFSDLGALFDPEIEPEPTIIKCNLSLNKDSEAFDIHVNKSNVAALSLEINKYFVTDDEKNETVIKCVSTPASPSLIDIFPLFDCTYELDSTVSCSKPAIECPENLPISALKENLTIANNESNSQYSIESSTINDEALTSITIGLAREAGTQMLSSETAADSSPSSLTYLDLGALFDSEIEPEPTIIKCNISLNKDSEAFDKHVHKSNVVAPSLEINNYFVTNDEKNETVIKCVSTPASPCLIDIFPLFDCTYELDSTVSCSKPAIECPENLPISALKENLTIANNESNSQYSIESSTINDEALTSITIGLAREAGTQMLSSETAADSSPSSLTYLDLGALFDSEIEPEPTIIKCNLSLNKDSEAFDKHVNKSNDVALSLEINNYFVTDDGKNETVIKCVSTPASPSLIDIFPLFDCTYELDSAVSCSKPAIEYPENLPISALKENLTIANNESNSQYSIQSSTINDEALTSITIGLAREAGTQMLSSETAADSSPSSLTYLDLSALFDSEIEPEPTIIKYNLFLDKVSGILSRQEFISNGITPSPDLNKCDDVNGETKEVNVPAMTAAKHFASDSDANEDYLDCKSDLEYSESSSNCDYDSRNSSDNDDSNVYNKLNSLKSNSKCHSELSTSNVFLKSDFKSEFSSLQSSEKDSPISSYAKCIGRSSSETCSDLTPLLLNESDINEINSSMEASINDGLNSQYGSGMEAVINTLQPNSRSDYSHLPVHYGLEVQLESKAGDCLKYDFETYSFSPSSLDLHKLISTDVELCDVKMDADSTNSTSLSSLASPNYQHINSIYSGNEEGVVINNLNLQPALEEFNKSNDDGSPLIDTLYPGINEGPTISQNSSLLRSSNAENDDTSHDAYEDDFKILSEAFNFPSARNHREENCQKNNFMINCPCDCLFHYGMGCQTNETSSNYSDLPGITSNDTQVSANDADSVDPTKNNFSSLFNDSDEDVSLKSSAKDPFKSPIFQNIEVILNSDIDYSKDNLEERTSETFASNSINLFHNSDTVYVENQQTPNYRVSSSNAIENYDFGIKSYKSNSEDSVESHIHSILKDEVSSLNLLCKTSSESLQCLQLNALFNPDTKCVVSVGTLLNPNDSCTTSTTSANLKDNKVETSQLVLASSSEDTHEKLVYHKVSDSELTHEELADEKLEDEETTDEEQSFEEQSDEKQSDEEQSNEELADERQTDEETIDDKLVNCNLFTSIPDYFGKNYHNFTPENKCASINEYDMDDLVETDGYNSPFWKKPKEISASVPALKICNQDLIGYDSLSYFDNDNGYEEIHDEPFDRELSKTPDSIVNIFLTHENGDDANAYLLKQTYHNEREFLNSSFEICDDDDLSNSESEYYRQYENMDDLNMILGDSYETSENCSFGDIFDAELEISKHKIDICEFKKIIKEIHDLKILLGMPQKESSVDNEKDYGIEEDDALSEVSNDSDIIKIVAAQANENEACESDLESVSEDSTCGTLDLVSLFSMDQTFDVISKDTNTIASDSQEEKVHCKGITFSDINDKARNDSCVNLEDELRTSKELPCNINTISEAVDLLARNQNALDNVFYSNGRYCILKDQINNFCNFFSTLSQIFCKSDKNVCGSLPDTIKDISTSHHGTYVSFQLPDDNGSPSIVDKEPSPFPFFDIARIAPIPSAEMPTTFKLSEDKMSSFPFLEKVLEESEKGCQSSACLSGQKVPDAYMDEIFLTESSEYLAADIATKKFQTSNLDRIPNVESKRDINYAYQLSQNGDEGYCKKNENVQQENLLTKSTTTIEANIEICKY